MLGEHTLKLTIEYDGTAFSGYQTQGQGERTVQSVLTAAIQKVSQHEVNLVAAGRTDTGVHALGQVVSYQSTARIPTERLAIALNSLLPQDIAVARAEDADADFSARFSARRRTYLYTVWTRRTRSALLGRYALHLRRPVEIARMLQAKEALLGANDFAAFAKAGGNPGATTVRELYQLSIHRSKGDMILFRLTANGFLRSMVRNIVGALLQVGLGELSLSDVETILSSKDRSANPCAPAPAHGLCLLRVDY